jgi:hypothetical protein
MQLPNLSNLRAKNFLQKNSRSKAGFFLGLMGLLGLAAGLFYWGTRVETRRYRLEKLKVKVNGHPASDGRSLSILHISDLHLH